MTTLVLEKPGSFRVIETPAPTADLCVGEALVRVHRVGVCGTDWHAYRGRQPFFSYPRVLGHELGVEVIAVNDPDSKLRPGDRCSVEPYLDCQQCIACRRGRGNCCVNLKVLGVHVDGGMREQIVVPARKLHPSSKLGYDQLALVETLAIGKHGTARAQIDRGENVLVLGAGPVGLSVVPFVLTRGALPILADIDQSRLESAKAFVPGVRTTKSDADLLTALTDLTAGDLPTVVIDATGNRDSMLRTFDLVAPGGRIVFVGLFQGEMAFDDPNFHRRECTLMGSRNALPQDFKAIIELIEAGTIDTTKWITHRCVAEEFPAKISEWQQPGSGLLKAMLEIN